MLIPRAPLGIDRVTPKLLDWSVGGLVSWLVIQFVMWLICWLVT